VVGGDESVASRGEGFAGFLPMATHLVMVAKRSAARLTATAALARSVRIGGSHAVAAGGHATAEPLPGPGPEQFNVGQRQADLIHRLGEQAVDDFEQRAFRSLTTWAAGHLKVDHRSGLDAAGPALEQAGRGQLDPLTTVVIAPQEA
jgi:hypothetical protein